jgi:hypothetical protein
VPILNVLAALDDIPEFLRRAEGGHEPQGRGPS